MVASLLRAAMSRFISLLGSLHLQRQKLLVKFRRLAGLRIAKDPFPCTLDGTVVIAYCSIPYFLFPRYSYGYGDMEVTCEGNAATSAPACISVGLTRSPLSCRSRLRFPSRARKASPW